MGLALKRALVALVAFAAFFVAVDVRVGDARFSVFNRTVRHWMLVATIGHEACAFPQSTGNFPCGTAFTSTMSSTYALVGSHSGSVNVATNYLVTLSGTIAGNVTTTPGDTGHGGLWNPTSPVIPAGTNTTVTTTYTPLQTGSWSISSTNAGTLIDPLPFTYSVSNLAPGYPGLTAGWSVGNDSTFVTGLSGGAFGDANAASIKEGTANSQHDISTTITLTANQSYTYSLMVKQSVGSRNVLIYVTETADFLSAFGSIFNPSTCAFVSDFTFGSSTRSSQVASTTGLAAGWCLIQITGVLGNFTGGLLTAGLTNGTTFSYAGDGSSTILVTRPSLQ